MEFKKLTFLLTLFIIILSFVASMYGIFSNQGPGEYEFQSIYGEKVSIYGKGIYQNDSVAMAVQAKAQDVVTVLVGIPLLLFSLIMLRRNVIKGKLLLAGTVGYFLYTYITYSLVAMYNPLFLLYVTLMSVSFFAFILITLSIELEELKSSFTNKLPVRFIGSFILFLSFAVFMLWIGRIAPSITTQGVAPRGIEHYTTLVIQALDLGIIIPTGVIAGILIMKRKALGYLLSSIIIIKLITLLTALTAMIIGQVYAGAEMSLIEIIIFPIFNLATIYSLLLIMRDIKTK